MAGGLGGEVIIVGFIYYRVKYKVYNLLKSSKKAIMHCVDVYFHLYPISPRHSITQVLLPSPSLFFSSFFSLVVSPCLRYLFSLSGLIPVPFQSHLTF